jgi:hypothetical protein
LRVLSGGPGAMRPVAESGELAQSQACGAWRRATCCVPATSR